MAQVNPIILGSHLVPFRRYKDGTTYRDWVRRAAAAAIEDAAIEAADIDTVLFASESDFFSLQLAPASLLVDEIGLAGRAAFRIEAGGGSGGAVLRAGVMHIRAGMARHVLIIGYEHAASHLSGWDVRSLYGLSFDAELEGWAGATATMLYALSIQDYMQRYGTTSRQLAEVSVKNHGNACLNPAAHSPMEISVDDVLSSPVVNTPYRRLDCSPISDGACAMVLSHPGHAPRRTDRALSCVTGSGCATDCVRLAERPEPGVFSGKTQSGVQAYEEAGVTDPAGQIDVAELYDSYTGAELQGIEALGLAAPETATAELCNGEFTRDGRLPINLSGGLIGQGGAPGATGLAQAFTITRLLEGRYHDGLQQGRLFRRGLIDSHTGVATINVTHVLQRIEP